MSWRKVRRIVLFYSMVATGIVTAITGLVLYFWPHGPKAGQLIIFGFQKQFWQDIHTYLALTAAILIILHVIENKACVRMYIRETLKG
ncbi:MULTISPECIES: DUF4405 domain-containing protein [unclassified Archaeoglobus]|jgi:cytochrome b subunit of formate dehydrogenase|uniref:DUF4405 domain-containing protein n=1 Tax=unclassified Archaeoglobus TaxID=2643606 RepID=UPI0025BF6F53|nr:MULTISPECIES: DUF4405 domain-containing protein [unclassified Archaeoglobus]